MVRHGTLKLTSVNTFATETVALIEGSGNSGEGNAPVDSASLTNVPQIFAMPLFKSLEGFKLLIFLLGGLVPVNRRFNVPEILVIIAS